MKKRNFNSLFLVVLIVGTIFALPYIFGSSDVTDISYNQFVHKLEREVVDEIVEAPPFILLISKSGDKFRTRMLSARLADDEGLMRVIKHKGLNIKSEESSDYTTVLVWVSTLLPMLIVVMFFYFIASKMKGPYSSIKRGKGSVGRREKKSSTFKDVAGLAEAKQDLMEIVEFLKSPAKFKKLGAKIPKGVLMIGLPGTGKTLLARAVAGEAGVPFFNVSGAEFVEMFVGVGASRVRELFNNAKSHTPCIVFIDEIDAVARQRGSGVGGGNDEREQTLNQLLVEMDGFSESENVIVMAATNRADVLDKAVTRPGRFDRQVIVDVPTLQDRVEILKVHARNKPLSSSVDLNIVARKTSGLVGADLANILNEAAILAARNKRDEITSEDINRAVDRVIAGPERRSRVMSDREKEIVAYHEAGHALIAYMLPGSDPVHKISIIPTGRGALGYTMQLPQEDKFLHSRGDFFNEIKVLMGGRVAEEVIFKEITSGASNDIERATKIARDMVAKYGMSDRFGPQTLGEKSSSLFFGSEVGKRDNFSNETARELDEEIKTIIWACYEEAKAIVEDNIDKLKRVSEYLLKKEVITEDEVSNIMEGS